MSDLQFLQSTVRGILLPTIRNGASMGDVTQAASHAVSPSSAGPASTIMEATGLTKQQIALIAIGVIGIPFICGTCLDEYLRKHRYFRCLRWLQRLRILQYKKELVSVPNSRIVTPSTKPKSSSVATITPNLDNFPDPPSVHVSYSIENHPSLGPYDASSPHVLLLDTSESKRVEAHAVDPYGYAASCSFDIIGDPQIEPVTNHTRTSISTATVRQVHCKNFPDATQVTITYFDGERCLGKFLLGQEHQLTNLRETTREITVRAADGGGNVAERSFLLDQHSPMYISVFYSPPKPKRAFKSITVAQRPLSGESTVKINNSANTKITDFENSDEQLEHEESSPHSYRDIL